MISAVADNRVSRSGEPLFYRLSDTLSHQAPTSLLELPPDLLQPEAPDFRLRHGDAPGVPVNSWFRRLVLAWALQAGSCSDSYPPAPESTGDFLPKNGLRGWLRSPTGVRRPRG